MQEDSKKNTYFKFYTIPFPQISAFSSKIHAPFDSTDEDSFHGINRDYSQTPTQAALHIIEVRYTQEDFLLRQPVVCPLLLTWNAIKKVRTQQVV